MVLLLNLNNYFENPVVKYCYEHNKKILKDTIRVVTLDDCMDDIQKLGNSKYWLEKDNLVHVSNQLRFHYSTVYDNYLYLDGDSFIKDFSKILSYKNCTQLLDHHEKSGSVAITTGSFLHTTGRDCKFIKHYQDLYNTVEQRYPTDLGMYSAHPFDIHKDGNIFMSGDMALIQTDLFHFRTEFMGRFCKSNPDINKVTYSYHHNLNAMWIFDIDVTARMGKNTYGYPIKNNKVIPELELFELWKEQICYTLGRTVKFEEI